MELYSFFKKLCFQQPLNCYREDIIFSTVLVKKLLHTYKLFLRIVTLDNTRKNWPKSCVTGKLAFFEVFVSQNLLGPVELTLYLAQYLSRYRLEPNTKYPDVCYPL